MTIKSIQETTILIVTPTFNSGKTIARTIGSVITQQGLFNIVYHIQDGGSSDNTLEICTKYKQLLERNDLPIFCRNITISISSQRDEGMYDAIWQGFHSHTLKPCDWMAWINSDDILRPGACALLAEIDKQHGSNWIKWIGGRTSVADDETGMQIGHGKRPHNRKVIQQGLCEGAHWDFIQQEGVFFRNSLWERIDSTNGFKNFRYAGDWNLWRLFAEHAEFFQVPWATGTFFRVEGQISGSTRYLYEAEICATLSVEERTKSLLNTNSEEVVGYLIGTAYTTKEIFIVKSDQAEVLKSWQNKHTQTKQLVPKGLPDETTDTHRYSSILEVDDRKIPASIIIHKTDWQYPAITEKHAALKASQMLPEKEDYCYFGFPWATLVDMIECGDYGRQRLLSELGRYRDRLKCYKRVFTTCQHVLQYKYTKLLAWIGVTDVYWSHHTSERGRAINGLNVRAFPLYPLQATLHADIVSAKAPKRSRPFLYSFVGARNCDGYLTNIREWLVDELTGNPEAKIIARDQWHYQQDVYKNQIETAQSNELADANENWSHLQSFRAKEYTELMLDSIFTLCPSGSGPNSIRLWESLMLNSIPIILSDTHILPGPRSLWANAVVCLPETKETICRLKHFIDRIPAETISQAYIFMEQLKVLYGPDTFITDILSDWLDQISDFTPCEDLHPAKITAEQRYRARIKRLLSLRVDEDKKISAARTLLTSHLKQLPDITEEFIVFTKEEFKINGIQFDW
jgi:glycosyltransferase involved in cell wall biosynthesis